MHRTIAHIDIEIQYEHVYVFRQYIQYTICNQYQYIYDLCVHVLDLYIENLWMYLYYIIQEIYIIVILHVIIELVSITHIHHKFQINVYVLRIYFFFFFTSYK